MNPSKPPHEKRKTAIWIIVAVIAVVSFMTIKIVRFLEMAHGMD
jgi:hypothetical protein